MHKLELLQVEVLAELEVGLESLKVGGEVLLPIVNLLGFVLLSLEPLRR